MRYAIIFVVTIVCAVVAVGCSSNTPATESDADKEQETRALDESNKLAAAESWQSGISGYQGWQLAPGTQEMQADGGNPHGKYGSVYLNDIALAAVSSEAATLPDGAVFVRENFNEEQVLIKLTVMRKHAGGWFWSVYEPDGTVQAAGELQSCVTCHQGATHDGVFALSK